MTRKKSYNDPESIAEIVLGGIWTGLGIVFIEATLVGILYVFESATRSFIETHVPDLLVGAAVLFVAGFGVTLQSMLELQFWRGKWK